MMPMRSTPLCPITRDIASPGHGSLSAELPIVGVDMPGCIVLLTIESIWPIGSGLS